MDALSLYQHIGFSTHRLGNVLDLILSDFTSDAKVLTTAPEPFVTNHRAVIATLNIKRLQPATKEILVRQVSKVSVEQWNDEFNPDNVKLNGKLDITVSSLNTELHRVYDKLAPLNKCRVNLRTKQPWFDSKMKSGLILK